MTLAAQCQALVIILAMLILSGCRGINGVAVGCSEEFDRAVLHQLVNLDKATQERRDQLRTWATQLPDRCERAAYIGWIDFYDRRAADKARDDAIWDRAEKMKERLPHLPEIQ